MTSGCSLRTLIVDDDVDTCRNLQDILEDLGYAADIAHSGEAALSLLRRVPYDLALLDFKMPGMDGLTLYREIRKLRADTVALIATAYATHDVIRESLHAGVWRVLSKPVDVSPLMSLLEEARQQPLVLVVDDDHDLCASLWDLFRDRGIRAGIAHGQSEAESQLTGRDFQVVLIDMKLTEGDGGSVYQLVQQAAPRARTILISGYRNETEELIHDVLQAGADAVCYKPLDIALLLETLQRLLPRRS